MCPLIPCVKKGCMGLNRAQQITGFIALKERVFLLQAPVGGGCFSLLTALVLLSCLSETLGCGPQISRLKPAGKESG